MQRQVDRLEHQIAEQVAAGEEGSGEDLHQQPHGRQGGGVVDDWSVDQIRNLPARQVFLNPLAFPGDIVEGRVFGEIDTQQGQSFDGGLDGLVHPAQGGVLPGAGGEDIGAFKGRYGMFQHDLQPVVCLVGAAGQVEAELQLRGQRPHQGGMGGPGVLRQQFSGNPEVVQGRLIGGGLPGPGTGMKVETGQLPAFVFGLDQFAPQVEVVDDIDQQVIVGGLATVL